MLCCWLCSLSLNKFTPFSNWHWYWDQDMEDLQRKVASRTGHRAHLTKLQSAGNAINWCDRLWCIYGQWMVQWPMVSSLCQLLTRYSSLLFWPPMFGVLLGLAGAFCFTSITKQWFIFSIHGLQKTQTLCTFCVAYSKLQPASFLPLRLFML